MSREINQVVKMIMYNMQSQIRIQLKHSAHFIIHKSVQQGDAVACLLFSMTLEYAIRKSGLQIRGTILYKPVQLTAYAYDIVVIGRSLASMKEVFHLLEEARKEVVLVNEGKTKYLVVANTQNYNKPHTIEVGRYNFERVDSVTCRGSFVTGDDNVSEEITNRLISANRSYFGLRSQLKSQILSRMKTVLIYKTLVRPVFTYTAETWTVTKNCGRRLSIFKRKILCRMYGPTYKREGSDRRDTKGN